MTRRRFRRDPTHALFADQSQSIPDNLVALFGRIRAWNYSAETTRSAVGCSPRSGSETVASAVVIRRAGYGALGRLDRVRGVRFLRLTRRAADGPAQPEMTRSRNRNRVDQAAASYSCGDISNSPRPSPSPIGVRERAPRWRLAAVVRPARDGSRTRMGWLNAGSPG